MVEIKSVIKKWTERCSEYTMITECEGIEVIFDIGCIKDCRIELDHSTIDENKIKKDIERAIRYIGLSI